MTTVSTLVNSETGDVLTYGEAKPGSPLAALRAYNAAHASGAIAAVEWDEPVNASSPRGWYIVAGTPRGFYLDYGPDHYRSPHQYCGGINRLCRDCEPGNVLAVRYPGGPGSATESRYCLTVAEARGYVMLGGQVAGHHGVPGAHCCD